MPFTNQIVSIENPDILKLGYLVRRARIYDGISQSFVAKSLGIDPSRLAKIERGKSPMTEAEREILLREFDEIDMSEETAENLKGLFLKMIMAWGVCSQEKMNEVYQTLKENSGIYRFCGAFEYYDFAVMNYELLSETVPKKKLLENLKVIEEYAPLLKTDLYNYYIFLKAMLYQKISRPCDPVLKFRQGLTGLPLTDESEIMTAQIEYYTGRWYLDGGFFEESLQYFFSARNKLSAYFMVERMADLDYYLSAALMMTGNYIAAKSMLEKIRCFCHMHDNHENDDKLYMAEIIALIMSGRYQETLDFIRDSQKGRTIIPLFFMGRIIIYYVLGMSDKCEKAIREYREMMTDDPAAEKFAGAMELTLRDEAEKAVGICEELVNETELKGMKVFYIKVCELIAAKNNLYELELRYMRMRESIKVEFPVVTM